MCGAQAMCLTEGNAAKLPQIAPLLTPHSRPMFQFGTACGIMRLMGAKEKRLQKMAANPRDWSIKDVQAACRAAGVACKKPKRGDHYTISHPDVDRILTIPATRPIKPVYIRKLIRFINEVSGEGDHGE